MSISNQENRNRMEYIIRDEAKITQSKEMTKRLKMWLPYGLALSLIAACVKIFG